FSDRKGLATGLAVAGFGAAKAIASPIMQSLLDSIKEGGIYKMFLILAVVYFVMMFAGHFLLAKPADWHEPSQAEKGPSAIQVIKSKPVTFIGIWLMFYINITCGLALISQEKMIIKCIGLVGVVGILSSVTAIFNAAGRLGFSAWADCFKDRNSIYKIIFLLSIVSTGLVILTQGITNMGGNVVFMVLVLILLFVVNAGYGGGFSNVPTLLADHYGMSNISAIHGITLSAWAIAGLSGNQLASWIVKKFGTEVELPHVLADGTTEMIKVNPSGYQMVLYVTIVLYVVAAIICLTMIGKKSADAKEA
ncbi:MAG TPA: MFS transporter, partial [Lachnospiraceae bacterium]|nr:MFS transporter [Lachnospiraceae bacterium]